MDEVIKVLVGMENQLNSISLNNSEKELARAFAFKDSPNKKNQKLVISEDCT
jgi:hypothetical protein